MTNTVLSTISYHYDQARRFVVDVGTKPYYFFSADHTVSNNTTINVINSSTANTVNDIYRNMISGKRITANDVVLAVKNRPYQADMVYDMYDDLTTNQDETNFYVVVNASSFHHVFKCLDNNMGKNSVIEPNFSDIVGSNTHLYQTSDGYRWKYMCSYSSADALHFATNDYIPFIANVAVQTNTTPGSIDIVKIIDQGKGYHNYLTGTFATTDLVINGDTTLFSVSNSTAKTVNGYYTDCVLYLTSGTGAGQFRTITDYITTGNGNFIQLNTFFDTPPKNGTQYEIYPRVQVRGTGTETVNAIGRALVNSLASNIVYRVEMLEPGENYLYATAQVLANAAVGVTSNAVIRPIMSPPGGHGFNGGFELYCRNAIVSATFANSESNTIPSTNFYKRVGILKNPRFYRVTASLSGMTGAFLPNETLIKPSTKVIKFNVATISGNSMISSTSGDFRETLNISDQLILRNGDSSTYQYVTINAITNSSTVVLNQNVFFTASNSSILLINSMANAVVNAQPIANTLVIANATPDFVVGSIVYGVNSGAQATITSTNRGGVVKDYSTFVQLYKYVGALTFGSFNQNEFVFQGNSKAYLHSYRIDSGIITAYTSNQIGSFITGGTITGNVSTAIMSVSAKYQPELVFGTGKPFYIENLTPITRTATESEVFKIVLNF